MSSVSLSLSPRHGTLSEMVHGLTGHRAVPVSGLHTNGWWTDGQQVHSKVAWVMTVLSHALLNWCKMCAVLGKALNVKEWILKSIKFAVENGQLNVYFLELQHLRHCVWVSPSYNYICSLGLVLSHDILLLLDMKLQEHWDINIQIILYHKWKSFHTRSSKRELWACSMISGIYELFSSEWGMWCVCGATWSVCNDVLSGAHPRLRFDSGYWKSDSDESPCLEVYV